MHTWKSLWYFNSAPQRVFWCLVHSKKKSTNQTNKLLLGFDADNRPRNAGFDVTDPRSVFQRVNGPLALLNAHTLITDRWEPRTLKAQHRKLILTCFIKTARNAINRCCLCTRAAKRASLRKRYDCGRTSTKFNLMRIETTDCKYSAQSWVLVLICVEVVRLCSVSCGTHDFLS